MKIIEIITESFNQPYPVKVTQSPDSGDYDAGVKLPDGTNMEILFTEHGGIWDMEFHRGGSQDLTGAGDAFRVFATMMEAVRQFIRMENPGSVSFTATKDVPEGQDPESRAKLYTRMVERFADSLGYNAYIDDYGDMVEYELVNKKHVSKPVEEGFTKPQLDVEWGEAQRYPEFRKIGKQAWIKLASKGRAVTVKDASDINNTDAANPDSFKTLDPNKQKRALAQVKSGKLELPVVAVYSDGYKELIGGNTRLTAMMAKHGKGIVWQFDVPDEIIENNVTENLVQQFRQEAGPQKCNIYDKRDNCGPAVLDFISWAESKGIKGLKRIDGFFKADIPVSLKKDFTREMKQQFLKDGGNWDSAEERFEWVSNSQYAEQWKYIPHYWVEDTNGKIYDPVGQQQFIDKGYAKDLNPDRYTLSDIQENFADVEAEYNN